MQQILVRQLGWSTVHPPPLKEHVKRQFFNLNKLHNLHGHF